MQQVRLWQRVPLQRVQLLQRVQPESEPESEAKAKMLRVVQLLVPKYPKCANSVVGNLVAPRTCSPSDLIVPRTCSPPNRSQKRKLFRVLRQCVVFSSRSNIGKDECGAVMDILLTHTLKLGIMNAMPVGQAPWASCQWFMHRH